ncbi:hypothetical protein Tco_1173131 [Tanacetum coccineum]
MNLLGEVVNAFYYWEALGLEINPLRSDQRLWGGQALIIPGADRKDKCRCLPGPYEEVLASYYVGCVSLTASP